MTEPVRKLATEQGRLRFELRGAVQGVGFRPFVYRLAKQLGLTGHVANTADGIVIEAEGNSAVLEKFERALQTSPPAHAEVRSITRQVLLQRDDDEFVIRQSMAGSTRSAIVLPDLATCDACLGEIFDPSNRRFLYPFTNCTECGPRYSILLDLPYDRANTAMSPFEMCMDCAREYGDPGDRRFHAEPVACPACGPQTALWDRQGKTVAARGEAIDQAAALIRDGGIVAVKGLGGFHLFADARNAETVQALRVRKGRAAKPFALMVPSLDAARQLCIADAQELALLASSAAPIVLLRKRPGSEVADQIAPQQRDLGLMLPYTPLHHLLMRKLGFPVVATSGNLAEEPIVMEEGDALVRLGQIADVFLVHDRAIVRAAEDSVMRVILGGSQVIRRGRGLAPLTLTLEQSAAAERPSVLAMGGHLKAAATLLCGSEATIGQHVGDLGTLEAEEKFARTIDALEALRGSRAEVTACDLHPDYATTRFAERLGRPLVRVQHHLAHIVSAMAEHGLRGPVLGIAWDGTGYGSDGTIWGGEFLLVEEGAWTRAAHLRRFRLPGAEVAVREPRRAALGMLCEVFGPDVIQRTDLPCVCDFTESERLVLRQMLKRGIQSPWTTSAGRVFDAFAALSGLTPVASHEGEAAMHLESLAEAADDPYPFEIVASGANPLLVDWQPMLEALLRDRAAGVPRRIVAGRIHAGLAAMMVAVVARTDLSTVVLTGGCFQNRLLTELAAEQIEATGRKVVLARAVPPNDGGLSLGQALWARWSAPKE